MTDKPPKICASTRPSDELRPPAAGRLHLGEVQQAHGPCQMAVLVVGPLFEQPISDGHGPAGSFALPFRNSPSPRSNYPVSQGQREIEVSVLDIPGNSATSRSSSAIDLAVRPGGVLGQVDSCAMVATLR